VEALQPSIERGLFGLAATGALAAAVARLARPGDVILLAGPLGAGKTAFARAFLRQACADPLLEVPSPSFTLVQTYPSRSGLVHHFDLWRLAGPGDLAELGWHEAREGIVIVEWPDRLGELAPSDALTITLSITGLETRAVRASGWPDRIGSLQ
jgi:tRNA threonylcarbamoyladenosine biosynthesis protein TsaE